MFGVRELGGEIFMVKPAFFLLQCTFDVRWKLEKNVFDHSHAVFAEMFIMRRDKRNVGNGHKFIPFSPTELLQLVD